MSLNPLSEFLQKIGSDESLKQRLTSLIAEGKSTIESLKQLAEEQDVDVALADLQAAGQKLLSSTSSLADTALNAVTGKAEALTHAVTSEDWKNPEQALKNLLGNVLPKKQDK